MILDLKPYPDYKDSGSLWLGKVPRHWRVVPNRALFNEIKDRSHPDEEMLSVTITRGIVRQKALLEGSSKKDGSNLNRSAYKLVQPGDIAYNKMRAWQGAIGASTLRGIVSPAYVVMRLRNADDVPSYFYHLYRTPQFAKEAERWSYGITSDMWSLRPEHFKMIPAPQPPPAEQVVIMHFLDHVGAIIERAIRAKKKLITLLNEQKRAIIHRTITRGLDPSVPLKHSGIDWLGEIPRHWEMTALRRYWRVTDCKHLTVPFVDDGIPVASVVEVQSFIVDLSRCKRTNPRWYRLLIDGDRKPRNGDILYCRNVSVGASALVSTDIDFAMGQDVCLIRSDIQNQRFLNYLLHSPFMKHQLELILVGSTFKRINVAGIKALGVFVPPRNEQDAICSLLDSKLSIYEAGISRAEQEIRLLHEYRTRLVASVVTGKVDARNAASSLPTKDSSESDEQEEANILEESELPEDEGVQ